MRPGSARPLWLIFLCGWLLSPLASAQDKIQVTFVNPGFETQGFWKAVTDTMRAAADQLGFHLKVHYGDREWPKMVQEARVAIQGTPKPDYLILVNEHQQGPELIKQADAAGIKTLFLLNTLTDEQLKDYGQARSGLKNWLGSITPDNEIAGYEMAASLFEQASRLGLAKDRQIDLLSLAGDHKTPASLGRLAGLDRALREFSPLQEHRRIAVNWSFDQAYNRTQLWLKSGQPLEALWAANDPIALGAIKAAREAGMVPGRDFVVTGLNWSPEAVDLVIDEELILTHGGHFLAGAWIMVLLYDYHHGRDFADASPHIHFPMTAIDAHNARTYKQHLGDSDWTKIDFSQFSRYRHPEQKGYEFTLTRLLHAIKEP